MAVPSRLARSAIGKLSPLPNLAIDTRGICLSLKGAARLRPTLSAVRPISATATVLDSPRYASNVPQESPAKKAQSIIDSLPGSSLISKTAILSAGASAAVYAISNEYYVVNEESIVMLATLSVFWAVFHYGGPMYKDWAQTQINRHRNILNTARQGHVDAVKSRIDNVKQLGSVIDITKSLFEVSKVCRFDF